MSRRGKPLPLARFIYVIGPQQGLQKVGLATDPQSRLATLQTASPFDLVMHGAVAVPFREAHSVERRAHRLLARFRVRNEWFETTPAEAVAAIHFASAPVAGSSTRAPDPALIWPSPSTWRIRKNDPAAFPPVPLGPEALPLFEFSRRAKEESPGFAPETPIEALGNYRLEIQCCAGLTTYPLRLLATSLPQGGRTPLSAALGLFRCERCRKAVRQAVLVEASAAASHGTAWKLDMTACA